MDAGGQGVAPNPPGSGQDPPAPPWGWAPPAVVVVVLAAIIAVATAGFFIFGFAVGCGVHWVRAIRRTGGGDVEATNRAAFRRGCLWRMMWAVVPVGLVVAAFFWYPNVLTRIAAGACAIYACGAFVSHKGFNDTKGRGHQPDLFETDGVSRRLMRQVDETSTKTTFHDFFFGREGETTPTKWELSVTGFCVAVAVLAVVSLLGPSPPLTPNMTVEVWIKQEASSQPAQTSQAGRTAANSSGVAASTTTTLPHTTTTVPHSTTTVASTTTTTTEPAPCATPKQMTKLLVDAGVPADVAPGMVTKWTFYDHLIGCPQGIATQNGSIWVEALGTASIPNAYLVGTAGFAQVLFPDFQAIVRPILSQLSSVSSRYRWGLGTAMGLDYANGSCSIAESYNSQLAILPPQSVVAIAAADGAPLHAFPRFLTPTPEQDQTVYVVDEYSPDSEAPSGVSAVSTLTITYDLSSGTATAPGFSPVSDDAVCSTQVSNLESQAGGLEASSKQASPG